MGAQKPIGDYLRQWRQRRRLSQLDFALEANISARHLSFIENGRSSPSRDMLLHLADRLEVPLRDRNVMLVAAGFAPVFSERPLADPALGEARAAIERILEGHNPFPALAVDRHWNVQMLNRTAQMFMADIEPELLSPSVNAMRVSLHPKGLAPRIENLPEWRAHLLHRLRQQVASTGDDTLAALLTEVEAFGPYAEYKGSPDRLGVAVPFRLKTAGGVLSFYSTITVFGTPLDVTLSELAIEAFFPADRATAAALQQL